MFSLAESAELKDAEKHIQKIHMKMNASTRGEDGCSICSLTKYYRKYVIQNSVCVCVLCFLKVEQCIEYRYWEAYNEDDLSSFHFPCIHTSETCHKDAEWFDSLVYDVKEDNKHTETDTSHIF